MGMSITISDPYNVTSLLDDLSNIIDTVSDDNVDHDGGMQTAQLDFMLFCFGSQIYFTIYILIHIADASDIVDHNVDDNDIVQVEEDQDHLFLQTS